MAPVVTSPPTTFLLLNVRDNCMFAKTEFIFVLTSEIVKSFNSHLTIFERIKAKYKLNDKITKMVMGCDARKGLHDVTMISPQLTQQGPYSWENFPRHSGDPKIQLQQNSKLIKMKLISNEAKSDGKYLNIIFASLDLVTSL